MYKNILIATDGSALSQRAAESGIALAKALHAMVTAVFVVDTRTLPGAHPVVPESVAPYYFSLMDELRKGGEGAVNGVAEACERAGVAVKTEVAEGTPGAALLEATKRHGADLLVMGTHGRSGIAALFLGSTTQAVLHSAAIPVLVVR